MVLWVEKAQLDLPSLEALMPGWSAAIWLPQKLNSVKAEFNSALLSSVPTPHGLVWAGRPAGPPPPRFWAPVLLLTSRCSWAAGHGGSEAPKREEGAPSIASFCHVLLAKAMKANSNSEQWSGMWVQSGELQGPSSLETSYNMKRVPSLGMSPRKPRHWEAETFLCWAWQRSLPSYL